MAEREGFEPKCGYEGISLNTARILSLMRNSRHDRNTRKIAVKISKSLNMGNRWATEREGIQSPSSEGLCVNPFVLILSRSFHPESSIRSNHSLSSRAQSRQLRSETKKDSLE